jgi:hypothetical protein
MTFLYDVCDTFIYIDDREILISPSEIKKNRSSSSNDEMIDSSIVDC